MIKEIIIYETEDGSRFDSLEAAKRREAELGISYERAIPVMDYLVGRMLDKVSYDRFVPICNLIFAMSMEDIEGRHLYEVLGMFRFCESGFYIQAGDLINYVGNGCTYKRKTEEIRKIEETEDIRLARMAFDQFAEKYPFIFELDVREVRAMIKRTEIYYIAKNIIDVRGDYSMIMPDFLYQRELVLKDPRPVDIMDIY